ncbi:MAG: FtsX-like permease family protein, partial [Ruminiclostridium sp.]|nr:FtsX-like permease family protein [Ruminiclostridium sp.]
WTQKDPHDYISVIMIKLAPETDPQEFVKQVEASGMEAKCILTGDTISSLQSQLEVTMQVMFALWIASLLIAILSLTGRFNALAKERKKEIGLLRSIGLRKGQVFGLIIGETCTMALMGGLLGSGLALLCMDPIIEMLKDAFKLSPSVWNTSLALLCGAAGVALAALLGFAAAVTPAWKSASMDPQTAITQGEVN